MAERSRPLRYAAFGATIFVAIVAVVIAGAAATAVEVRGISMEPTLDNHDRILVNPFSDHVSVSRTSVIVGRFAADEPEVVKRVIAVPGDRVYIRKIGAAAGTVFVQPGGVGPWQIVENPAWNGRWSEVSGNCCSTDGKRSDSAAAQTVPPGMLFLMGDNVGNSEDSRARGWAPVGLVKGPVSWKLYPLGNFGPLSDKVALTPAR